MSKWKKKCFSSELADALYVTRQKCIKEEVIRLGLPHQGIRQDREEVPH